MHRLSARARYAIALKATSRLFSDQTINDEEKALFKILILEDDTRILATIECYELNHDAEEVKKILEDVSLNSYMKACMILMQGDFVASRHIFLHHATENKVIHRHE